MSVPGKGGARKGTLHHKAKLTAADIRTIRRRRERGDAIMAIWLDYPQINAMSTIGSICQRKTWRHIP